MTARPCAGQHLTSLLSRGFCVVPDALPAETIEKLDADLADRFAATPFGTGGFYGETTKRFGRMLVRSRHAQSLVNHALILDIVEGVLMPNADCIQLNTTQAIAIHPGASAQLPHRDQDMWPAAKGEIEYLVNVMWPLVPFTPENGATQLWPGSHGAAALAEMPASEPETPALQPGSALVFLGSTLHAAGENRTDTVRRGIVIGYSLGWLKTYENQFLAYPPHLAKDFPPALASLVGYRQHRPNLGNYEGQCPSLLLAAGEDPDAPRGAVNAMQDSARSMSAKDHGAAAAKSGDPLL